MKTTLRLGTRGSRLALTQSGQVARALEAAHPGLAVALVKIKTTGDVITDVALSRVGGKGIFVTEIETALLEGRIDFAVHSMKDMPTTLPPGLAIACVPQRMPPFDCLVSLTAEAFADLPQGARIATGSLRRRAQLQAARPDLRMEDIRGNLPTRIQRLIERGLDATVLAQAGLARLGVSGLDAASVRFRIPENWSEALAGREVWLSPLPPDLCLPAVGQGALCLEAREDADDVRPMLSPLHHPDTAAAVACERALMRAVEGGCQVPVGGLAHRRGEEVYLDAVLADLDGTRVIRASGNGPDPEAVGRAAAESLLVQGGREILARLRALEGDGS